MIEFLLSFRYNERMQGGLFDEDREIVFSVGELSQKIKRILESGIGRVTVEGEVSSFTESSARHWYFTLKDSLSPALLNIVCFSYRRPFSMHKPAIGERLQVTGRLTAYDARSSYQLTADGIATAGLGDLLRQLEERKQRLCAEGLFAEERKQPLPPYPQTVGIITSAEGKVFHDICTRINAHRAPLKVILLPAAVQGTEAAASLTARIRQANRYRLCDVLILCRGGGSPEDLLPFSDEMLVRAVGESKIPILSAVGHEPDTPLCDFSADRRSATPTAAADDLCAAYDRSRKAIADARSRMTAALQIVAERQRALLDRSGASRLTELMLRYLQSAAQRLDRLRAQLPPLTKAAVACNRRRLDFERMRLEKESPTYILSKGYALVFDEKGAPLTKAAALKENQSLTLQFADGTRKVRTEESSS